MHAPSLSLLWLLPDPLLCLCGTPVFPTRLPGSRLGRCPAEHTHLAKSFLKTKLVAQNSGTSRPINPPKGTRGDVAAGIVRTAVDRHTTATAIDGDPHGGGEAADNGEL